MTLTVAGTVVRLGRGLDMQIRDVCAKCNAGWLSELEVAFASLVRPILLPGGEELSLDKAAQGTIAAWGIKTLFLLERGMKYTRGGAIESEDFPPYFMANLRPPPEVRIWIAEVGNARGKSLFGLKSTALYMSGLLVGRLYLLKVEKVGFLVFIPETWNRERAFTIDLGPALPNEIIQVWPESDREVHWPPPGVISEEILNGLFPLTERIDLPA